MLSLRRCATLAALLLAAAGLPLSAAAAAPAAPAPGAAPVSGATPGAGWTGTWAAAANGGTGTTGYAGYTIRNLVHTSVGGERVRVKLSNAFGTAPVLFAHTTVGLQQLPGSAAIAPRTLRTLTFGGQRAVTVPAGQEIYSDPVDLPIAAADDLFVSTFTPDPSGPVTYHDAGMSTSYYATDGTDHSADLAAAGLPDTTGSWHYVTEVDVQPGAAQAAAGSGSVVTLGDSITDGIGSTSGADRRWPDLLSARLRASHGPASGLGVMNAGISGNRVLTDGAGQAAVTRLDRDVLQRAGARTVIVLEGINDIQLIPGQGDADQIIAGLHDIADRSHAAGLRVLGATLTPFEGWGTYSPAQEGAREAVNTWIRDSGVFDAVVDFDAAVRDPADPHRMLPAYDSGDHLHPGDAGYRAMADSVDLNALGRPGPVRPAPAHRPERSLSVAASPRQAVALAGRAATLPFVSRTTVQAPGTVRGTVTATLDGKPLGKGLTHSFSVRSDGRFAQVDVAQDIPVPATETPGEHHVAFTVRTFAGGRTSTAVAGAVLDVRSLGCGATDDSCPVDLSGAYDRDAIATAAHPEDGNFDDLGWSYAAETLPAAGPQVLAGTPFDFPSSADGVKNAVTAHGQTLALPGLRADRARLLGAASGGSADAVATVTYTDGTTADVPLGFSDWAAGSPQSGEDVAVAAAYRYKAGVGRDGPAVKIFARTLPLDPTRTVSSLTLPDQAQLKLFAVTLDQSKG